MRWTITGSAPLSKTYTSKQQFLDEVIAPLNQRLAKKITPKVRSLHAEGDVVIALWDGTATACDGQPYNVTYSWHMRLVAGKIVEVTAFLDTLGFADIFQRIPAGN
jgi:ketosteroid isomerase-like protein